MFNSTPFFIINMFCKPNTIFLNFSFITKQQFLKHFYDAKIKHISVKPY
jgi:predicted RNA-binding protein